MAAVVDVSYADLQVSSEAETDDHGWFQKDKLMRIIQNVFHHVWSCRISNKPFHDLYAFLFLLKITPFLTPHQLFSGGYFQMILIDKQSILNNDVGVRSRAYRYEPFLFQLFFLFLISFLVDLKQNVFPKLEFIAYFLTRWQIGECNGQSLRGGSSEKRQSRYNIGQIHTHFEQIGPVAGDVPIFLCEEQEGSLANLPPSLRINFGPNEFLLRLVEVVMRVIRDGGSEITNEDIPVDD